MSENSVCSIWGTPASVEIKAEGHIVDSSRAGGKYFIFDGGLRNILQTKDESYKARLTSWLIKQRQLGVEHPKITKKTITEIELQRELSVPARADMFLRYLYQLESYVGAEFSSPINQNGDEFLNLLAWSESAVSTSEIVSQRKEIQFFLDYLEAKNWIIKRIDDTHHDIYHLTVKGYARLDKLDKVAVDSSQAFVAMWFDKSMDDVYYKGIKLGIKCAGYKPFRIDKEEYLDKVDDKIIAEIRRSRFIVADFTYKDIEEIENCKDKEELKKVGARGSVYYEAGFAEGQNIPVIFTCKADLIEKVHFDTRQYPHILWEPEKLEEFSKALANRIAHVIGDGPFKAKDKNENSDEDSRSNHN